ncbi:unnamed protein product [Phytophthora fragariaefolia]|uniref:Unnamed protein product n=1 Tax=Phytophthora fragariaefolia TaxID=1490495 RepID=A0A9W6XCF3_9STRA|nr:unnamed protein product [Phytophthora fragariaefolia]
MRDETSCKSPELKWIRQQAKNALETWPRRELFHVRRDCNASADILDGQDLQCQDGLDITGPDEIQSLRTLNRLGEVIRPRTDRPETSGPEWPTTPSADAGWTTAPIRPVTTRAVSAHAAAPRTRTPEALQELVVQRLRLDRVRTAQDQERWIANLKRYMCGELGSLSKRKAKDYRDIAPQYAERESGPLYYRTPGNESVVHRDATLKLVIPESSRTTFFTIIMRVWDVATKTSDERINASDHISTGQGSSRASSAMSRVYGLRDGQGSSHNSRRFPRQHRRNIPVSSHSDGSHPVTTRFTVAAAYEEAVVRRFGAREAIRHDREPGFMADFFRAFSKMMGRRQRATLAYRPQANGAAERKVQTVVRAVKMYITDIDQRDWDEYAESLIFALNTPYVRTRDETPFYLVHGWDARSTLEAALSVGTTSHRDAEATLANADPKTL